MIVFLYFFFFPVRPIRSTLDYDGFRNFGRTTLLYTAVGSILLIAFPVAEVL